MSPTVLCPSLTSTTRIHYWYDGTEYCTTGQSTTGQYNRRCSTWHAPDPDVFPPTFVHTPLMLSMYAIMLSCMLLSFMERSRYFKFGVLRMVFYIVLYSHSVTVHTLGFSKCIKYSDHHLSFWLSERRRSVLAIRESSHIHASSLSAGCATAARYFTSNDTLSTRSPRAALTNQHPNVRAVLHGQSFPELHHGTARAEPGSEEAHQSGTQDQIIAK